MNRAELRIIEWLKSLDTVNCQRFGKLYKVAQVAEMTNNFRSYIFRRRLNYHDVESIVLYLEWWEGITRSKAREVIQEYKMRKKSFSVLVLEGLELEIGSAEFHRLSLENRTRLTAHYEYSKAVAKLVASVRGTIIGTRKDNDTVRQDTFDVRSFLQNFLELKPHTGFIIIFIIIVQILFIFSL